MYKLSNAKKHQKCEKDISTNATPEITQFSQEHFYPCLILGLQMPLRHELNAEERDQQCQHVLQIEFIVPFRRLNIYVFHFQKWF